MMFYDSLMAKMAKNSDSTISFSQKQYSKKYKFDKKARIYLQLINYFLFSRSCQNQKEIPAIRRTFGHQIVRLVTTFPRCCRFLRTESSVHW